MKILLYVLICALIASCSPAPVVAPTPAPCSFITSWKSDTLYAGNTSIIKGDSIITGYCGDTTVAYYHSTKLYVYAIGTTSDSTKQYLNCYISPVAFDTVTYWTKCSVTNPRFYSASLASWKEQAMAITIYTVAPHFSTTVGNVYIGY